MSDGLMPKTILQDWVCKLPNKMQEELILAIGYFDSVCYQSNKIPYYFKASVLLDVQDKEADINKFLNDLSGGTIKEQTMYFELGQFIASLDQYDFKFVRTVAKSSQIIAMVNPSVRVARFWDACYHQIAASIHMKVMEHSEFLDLYEIGGYEK